MIASSMQPYFFPYIGYFQLMAASDVFVIADNVQYIQAGWVNRNRILVNGGPSWITVPVARADHRLPINCREYLLDHRLTQRLRRRIVSAYRKAPHFREAMIEIDIALDCPDPNVARFNTHLLRCVAGWLDIGTPIEMASSIPLQQSPSGQDTVIEICSSLGASGYINPIGGVDLYDPDTFAARGLSLHFLRSTVAEYSQFGGPHVSSLSIIDSMMFSGRAGTREMLDQYELLPRQHVKP